MINKTKYLEYETAVDSFYLTILLGGVVWCFMLCVFLLTIILTGLLELTFVIILVILLVVWGISIYITWNNMIAKRYEVGLKTTL